MRDASLDEKPFSLLPQSLSTQAVSSARHQEAVQNKMLCHLAASHMGRAGVKGAAHRAGLSWLPLLPQLREQIHELTAHKAQLSKPGAPYVHVGACKHQRAGVEIKISALNRVHMPM